jgi:DNA transposition AAA+ family ATPase
MRHKTVKTSNVVRFLSAVRDAHGRSPNEEGMIYLAGEPGEGKTTTISYCWNSLGGAYLRAMRHWTPLSMLQALCRELELERSGRTAYCFERITEELVAREQFTLFVDEVDYLFSSADLLDTLRDLYDVTRTPVVFCGEDKNAKRLQQNDRFSRFRRRFLRWVEFDGITEEDALKVAGELVEETSVAAPLARAAHAEAGGNIDALVSRLGEIERFGQRNGLEEVTRRQWEDAQPEQGPGSGGAVSLGASRSNGHAAAKRAAGA